MGGVKREDTIGAEDLEALHMGILGKPFSKGIEMITLERET